MPKDHFKRYLILCVSLHWLLELEMDSDFGTTIMNVNRVSDLSPPTTHPLLNNVIRRPDEKTKDHVKLVLIAAIALFSMTVFFFSALRLSRHVQNFNFRPVAESKHDVQSESRTKPLPPSMPGLQVRFAAIAERSGDQSTIQSINLQDLIYMNVGG